jgi:hypothetical protein
MRAIVPLLLIISAIGIFVFYTDPQYQSSKALAEQVATYDNALNKSQELKKLRDDLLFRRNKFSPDSLSRLQEFLPDNIDNIRLVINIDNVASRHSLSIKDVQIGMLGGAGAQTATVGASSNAINSVTLGFTVSASYDTFLSFLADLEHSQRAIDVQHITFTSKAAADPKAPADMNDYQLTIRTYWLP